MGASAAMGHVWFKDCESLFSTKQVDSKRLAIDFSALKQLIWDNRDDCDEEVDGSKGNYPRWIDTSAMLSDCATKTMASGRLNETLRTGIFDMRPTEESLAIRAKKTESGERRRKSRNSHRIPILELLTLAMRGESDSVLVKRPSTRNVNSAD